MELEDDWFLGGSVVYEDNWFSGAATQESANGNGLLLGLALKKQTGPLMLSASVAGGNIWNPGSRLVNLPGTSNMAPLYLQARSSNEICFFDTKLRTSYDFVFDKFYLRPALDLDLLIAMPGGYREKDAGLYGLNAKDTTRVLFIATPMVEAGQQYEFPDLAGGFDLRTYAQLGMSVMSNDRWNANANFVGVPGGNSFNVTAPMPQAYGKAGVGVEVFK